MIIKIPDPMEEWDLVKVTLLPLSLSASPCSESLVEHFQKSLAGDYIPQRYGRSCPP